MGSKEDQSLPRFIKKEEDGVVVIDDHTDETSLTADYRGANSQGGSTAEFDTSPVTTLTTSFEQRKYPQIPDRLPSKPSTEQQKEYPSMSEIFSVRSTVFNDNQRPILPRPADVPNARLTSNIIGDYLHFVDWIRCLLLRMHPELSELPDEVPLVQGLKWPERHAWGRKVDEECPEHWKRFRSKEAKRLSALSNRCFNLMTEIGTKILRGDMRKSTPSKEAGSTTFDFLTKKNEQEQFEVLSLVDSGELFIKDANAMSRQHREKRNFQNCEEISEHAVDSSREERAPSMVLFKKQRLSEDSLNDSLSRDIDASPFVSYMETRSEDSDTEISSRLLHSTFSVKTKDNRLKKLIEELKVDLKESQTELQKAQEKVIELEEENEIYSSLLTDQRTFQKQQCGLYKRHIMQKDEIIQRLKNDLNKLTGIDNDMDGQDRRDATSGNFCDTRLADGEEQIANQSQETTTPYAHQEKNIQIGDYILYHTVNGKFYMGKVAQPSEIGACQDQLCVEYAESIGRNRFDFSQRKTTCVTKESIFRWGGLDAIGAKIIGVELYSVNKDQT